MVKISEVEVCGITYTVKAATRGELTEAHRLASDGRDWEAENMLVELCVVSPKIDLDRVYAGIVTTLSQFIIEISGASEEESDALQKESEEWILSPVGKSEALMMGILGMTPKDIAGLYSDEWHKAATAAKFLAVTLHGIPLQEFMDKGTEREKKQKPQGPRLPPQARP